MKLLQYKSTEMFSSTELIRKSKTIFNKIIDKAIDKAIILRDGKPSFLLMDFAKYERIMAEYEVLKGNSLNIKKKKSKKIKDKNKKAKITSVKPIIEPKLKKKTIPILKMEPTFPLPVRDENKYTNKIKNNKNTDNKNTDNNDIKIRKIETKNEELSEEQELNVAMKSLDTINLDDDLKKIAETKIKDRILIARKNRKTQKEEELKRQKEQDLQEQMILEKAQASKEQKEKELSEFWD